MHLTTYLVSGYADTIRLHGLDDFLNAIEPLLSQESAAEDQQEGGSGLM